MISLIRICFLPQFRTQKTYFYRGRKKTYLAINGEDKSACLGQKNKGHKQHGMLSETLLLQSYNIFGTNKSFNCRTYLEPISEEVEQQYRNLYRPTEMKLQHLGFSFSDQ